MCAKKLEEWVIPALFLIIPFSVLSFGLIWKSHLLFFIVMGLAVLSGAIKNVWIRLFLLYAFVWQIIALLKGIGDPGSTISIGAAISMTVSLISGAIVYKFVSTSNLEAEVFFRIIRIAVLLQISIAFCQLAGFDPTVWVASKFVPAKGTVGNQMTGTLGNRNFIASFIAMSLPVFFTWRLKSAIKIPIVAIVVLALISSPGPGVIAALIGTAVYLNGSRIIFAMCAVLGITYAAVYIAITGYHVPELILIPNIVNDYISGQLNIAQHDAGRVGMWLMAFAKLSASWGNMVFGLGPGGYWGRNYPLHSEYMFMWFHFGMIGVALLCGYILTTVKYLQRERNRVLLASFVILLIDMSGNYPMEVATTAFMALIICGLIERERLKWQIT